MIEILLVGAMVGLGAFTVALYFDRGGGTAAAELASLDATRHRNLRNAAVEKTPSESSSAARSRRLGSSVWAYLERRGVRVPPGLRADLAVMNRTIEAHVGASVLAGVAGLFAPSLALAPAVLFFGASPTLPLWLSVVGGASAIVLVTAQVSSQAKDRRRDFRHVVSAFLDLVSMNLAGGRGVPEALTAASGLSGGWAMVRIRDTMEAARLQGVTPWAALGDLGFELGVEELRDLAAALALVAEDGAKVRDSLSARAASMRQRELAETESRAAQQSQSMLVAQLLLCVGFLLFLIYPAIAGIIGI